MLKVKFRGWTYEMLSSRSNTGLGDSAMVVPSIAKPLELVDLPNDSVHGFPSEGVDDVDVAGEQVL